MKEKTILELKPLTVKSFTTSEERQIAGGWLTTKTYCSSKC